MISNGKLFAERTVEQLHGDTVLLIRADPIEKAHVLIEASSLHGDVLHVREIDAGAFVRTRCTPTSTCRRLRRLRRTLEEVFFEMTGAA